MEGKGEMEWVPHQQLVSPHQRGGGGIFSSPCRLKQAKRSNHSASRVDAGRLAGHGGARHLSPDVPRLAPGLLPGASSPSRIRHRPGVQASQCNLSHSNCYYVCDRSWCNFTSSYYCQPARRSLYEKSPFKSLCLFC
jgi:hypothetical protein